MEDGEAEDEEMGKLRGRTSTIRRERKPEIRRFSKADEPGARNCNGHCSGIIISTPLKLFTEVSPVTVLRFQPYLDRFLGKFSPMDPQPAA